MTDKIAILSEVERRLANIHSIDEAKAIRDQAEAIRVYAKSVRAGLAVQNRAAAIKALAERRAGALTAKIERAKNRKRGDQGFRSTLEQIGVSIGTAHKWQQIATIPEAEIRAREAACNEEQKELTSAALMAEVKRRNKPGRRAEKLAATVWPDGRYGVILADPPWRPDAGVLDPSRQIENQYPTLDLDGLIALRDDVAALALPDCVLLMWTTAQKIGEAIDVIRAWEFVIKSGAVWIKPSIGMGYWFRQRHELLILATRGNPDTPLEANRPDSVITSARRGHSEKPDDVYTLVERMFPTIPKVEIFARAQRAGWAHATNEPEMRTA